MARNDWVLQPGYNPLGLHDLYVLPRASGYGTSDWQRQTTWGQGYAKYLQPSYPAWPTTATATAWEYQWPRLADPFDLRLASGQPRPADQSQPPPEPSPEAGTRPIRQVLSEFGATFRFEPGDGGKVTAACGDVPVLVSGGTSSAQVDGTWVALRQTSSLYQGAMYADPSLAEAVRRATLKRKSAAASARMPATDQPVLVRNPDETFPWAGGGEVATPTAPSWETPAERLQRTGYFWPDNAADAGKFVAGLAVAPVVAATAAVVAPVVQPLQTLGLAKRQWDLWQQLGWREGTSQFWGERWQAAKEPFDLANAKSPFDMGLAAGSWMLLAYGVAGVGGHSPASPAGANPAAGTLAARPVQSGAGELFVVDASRLNYSRLVLRKGDENFMHGFDFILDRHIIDAGSVTLGTAHTEIAGLSKTYLLFRAPGTINAGTRTEAWFRYSGTYELGLRPWSADPRYFEVMHRFFLPSQDPGAKVATTMGGSEFLEESARIWRTQHRLPQFYQHPTEPF